MVVTLKNMKETVGNFFHEGKICNNSEKTSMQAQAVRSWLLSVLLLSINHTLKE